MPLPNLALRQAAMHRHRATRVNSRTRTELSSYLRKGGKRQRNMDVNPHALLPRRFRRLTALRQRNPAMATA